jgi:hypothetical protein
MDQPGLLLTIDDVERLRAANGPPGAERDRCLAAAEALLDEPVAQPDLERPWAPHLTCASQRLRNIQRVAFAYLLTADRRFHQRAKATVDAMLDLDLWTDPCHLRDDRRYTLMNGVVSQALAHYLDWCREAVDDEEIALIADHYRQKAVEPLLHDMELPAPFFRDKVNNWVPVMVGGAGLMALLLMQREPFYQQILERCVFHLRRYLTWINDDGSTDEGGNYWAFGMEHALPLLEALRLRGSRLPASLRWRHADRLHEIPDVRRSDQPALARTGYFPLYCIQGDTYAVNFGDTDLGPADRMAPPLRCLARLFGDPHIQWLADRLETDSPLALVWHDPDLEPQPPSQLSPSRAFHGAGWAIVRSDLETPDGLLLAVRAGDNAKTHSHRDLGTFILRAGGQELICDPGRPQYCADYWSGGYTYGRETIGHNCVLIDGEGQSGGEDERATITRLEDLGDRKYLTVDVTAPAIGLRSHRRTFDVMIDEPTTVLLRDTVHLERAATVTWLFHFPPEAQAELREDCIIIRNGPASLTINAAPDEPVSVNIERDHPVPFVALEIAEPAARAVLELECVLDV